MIAGIACNGANGSAAYCHAARRLSAIDPASSGCACAASRRNVRTSVSLTVTVQASVPRSSESGKHADELAARFEGYDPDPAQELDPDAVHLLRQAVQERSEDERHIVDALRKAREVGRSRSVIGAFVGITGEAARQRYGGKVA